MHPSSSAQAEYRVLLQRLATVSPPLFVMGGFAEEALLFTASLGSMRIWMC
jgi:hypothetical protein